MPDSLLVKSMFGRIARRYDFANRLLSGGLDTAWRRRLIRAVRSVQPREVLDLATGSGDVALALSRALPGASSILGMDFCPPMLEEAEKKKKASAPAGGNVRFQVGDALALPLPDASVDAITIAFGLRNLANRGRGLAEMRRVLRPGGHLFILEFSQPIALLRPFYFFYLRHVLPTMAGAVTGDRGAYVYLNETIEQWPDRGELCAEMRAAGFAPVEAQPLSAGIVALHRGQRPPAGKN